MVEHTAVGVGCGVGGHTVVFHRLGETHAFLVEVVFCGVVAVGVGNLLPYAETPVVGVYGRVAGVDISVDKQACPHVVHLVSLLLVDSDSAYAALVADCA